MPPMVGPNTFVAEIKVDNVNSLDHGSVPLQEPLLLPLRDVVQRIDSNNIDLPVYFFSKRKSDTALESPSKHSGAILHGPSLG